MSQPPTAGKSVVATSADSHLTLRWVEACDRIAVPVYQREYRWSVDTCDRLLEDIRTVAAADANHTHFIGSVLATQADSGVVTLVDGQQRVTTVFLILAAVRVHARAAGSPVAEAVAGLVGVAHSDAVPRARLAPHERYADVFHRLLFGDLPSDGSTTFEQNFAYLVDAVADDWEEVWAGLQRVEHVVISLGERANAQQVFESLNSTGEALSDDELIHNYIHMGRAIDAQLELERRVWEPIEEAAAGALRSFWRDYMVFTGQSQPALRGEFGVYQAFRMRYPAPARDITPDVTSEWVEFAEAYGVVLQPDREPDVRISTALRDLRHFESTPRPLAMGLYAAYRASRLSAEALVDLLDRFSTMIIRRAQVDMPRGLDMIGTMCRELNRGEDPREIFDKRTPENPAIRLALMHSSPANVGYVLRRLQKPPAETADLQIEHIHPQTPTPEWSGDGGTTTWGGLPIARQAEYRALLNTLGNLTLLEGGLNASASNKSFRDKAAAYAKSTIEETRSLADLETWDIDSIERRTALLTEHFLQAWPRRSDRPLDEPDDLVNVVDLVIPNTRTDAELFEYATYGDDVWGDVHTARELYRRVAETLYALDPQRFRSAPNGGHVSTVKVARTHMKMRDGNWLYTAWWPSYLLEAARKWIHAFDLQDEFRVKRLPDAIDGEDSFDA